MKPLLTKTTKPFLMYVLFVLAVSIPVYYYVVDSIWVSELDEHNMILCEKTAQEFNRLNLTDDELAQSIALWNHIRPGTNIERIPDGNISKDSIYTVQRRKLNSNDPSIDRFRGIKKTIVVNSHNYRFTAETNVEETRETVTAITITTILLFSVIVFGLLYLTRRLSITVWQPFRNTLDRLRSFNLDAHSEIAFDKTDIREFDELNRSLGKLIEHSISVYKTQKEFTENASHELQTPLAILKTQLGILLQDEDLTEKQYNVVENMNIVLSRSTRINKNLLLLAKIENQQFDVDSQLFLTGVVQEEINLLREHFDQKNIHLATRVTENVFKKGNQVLAEVLVSNLILNAIRHTSEKGFVHITLTESVLEVSNSGTEALDTSMIFQRFSKLSPDNSGSGLGLAIIKEICNRLEWSLSYRFDLDKHVFGIRF